MIRFDTDHSDEITAWVADRIPHVRDFGPAFSIGVLQDDELIAGVVYHDYQPDFDSIQLSMAADSPRWAKKEIIAGLLVYPFRTAGCYRVWTATPLENIMALKVNLHIGFTRETVSNSMFGEGKHGVLMRLLRPDFERIYGG